MIILKPLKISKMTYIRFHNPYFPAYRDENENEAYDRLVNHFSKGCGCINAPASNISETDKEFTIEMALPGVNKDSISIKHEKDLLTVSVVKPEEKETKEEFTRHEFDYAGAFRTFRLGNKVDTGKITAKYENGILHLILPKKEVFVDKPVQSIVVE
jgi:HSP20 family protein